MNKKQSSEGLLFILFAIALFLDVIEILETILDLGIIGFILFLITTPLNLLFYALIFFSGLWNKIKSNKRLVFSFFAGLIGENIPIIEILPINTLNILLIALQERPEMFGKIGSIAETGLSFANKVSLVSSAKTRTKLPLKTQSLIGEFSAMTILRRAKLTGRATQSPTKLLSKTAKESRSEETPKILRKAKTAPLIASIAIIILFSFLPLVTRAQYYNQQDYSDIMRPFLELIQPFPKETAPSSPLASPKKEAPVPKENVIYLSVRKVTGGLMIGVEPIILENGQQLSAEDFRYQFQIPELSLQRRESWQNIFVFRTFDLPDKLTIKLVLTSLKSDIVYKTQKSFLIPTAKLVLVSIDPETNLISPFNRNSRFVTVLPFYFTSEKLHYRWLMDNNVFSESPMIEFNPQKSITVEVINPYNSKEKAVQFISSP